MFDIADYALLSPSLPCLAELIHSHRFTSHPSNPHLRSLLLSVTSYFKGPEDSAEVGNQKSVCEISLVRVRIQYRVQRIECPGEHSSNDAAVLTYDRWRSRGWGRVIGQKQRTRNGVGIVSKNRESWQGRGSA